ncbi:hypothetical protein D3C76_952560 [compost metagenome]
MVDVGVLVLQGSDKAAAHAAGVVQRTGDITFGAVIVPGANSAADRSLEVLGRFLAHQVDGGGRVTSAGHQAGRALDDFDAVEAGGVVAVVRVFTVDTVVGNVDAIVLKVGDGKATGGKLGTVAVVLLHGDAGRVTQDITHTL